MDTSTEHRPQRVIQAAAPIRICDNGGWTDTWFAGHGAIFNIGVSPYAEIQIQIFPATSQPDQILLYAENFGDRYAVDLDQPGWGRHPLLEATIRRMGVPEDLAVRITLFSLAPSGASTGTSAAITVALIGALDRLNRGMFSNQRLSPQQVAEIAHLVETEMLGRQCGIQDQLCSAYGGINFISMPDYPHGMVTPIHVPDAIWWELERQLALVYLGRSHDSSKVHEKVIAELEWAGPDCQQLADLRLTAELSRQAVIVGDFPALGRAMVANTEAQERLHPELVGQEARRVIEIAREHGATGWKVNGAGGEGGSITLLCGPRAEVKRTMLQEIKQENPSFQVIPIQLDRYGLRVWESQAKGG